MEAVNYIYILILYNRSNPFTSYFSKMVILLSFIFSSCGSCFVQVRKETVYLGFCRLNLLQFSATRLVVISIIHRKIIQIASKTTWVSNFMGQVRLWYWKNWKVGLEAGEKKKKFTQPMHTPILTVTVLLYQFKFNFCIRSS